MFKNNTKLQYFLISIGLFILVIIAFFSINNLKKNYKKEIEKTLIMASNSVQSAYYLWVDKLKIDIEGVASDAVVIKLTEKLLSYPADSSILVNSDAQLQLRNYLKPHLKSHRYLGFFIISINDHISYGSTRNSNIGIPNLISNEYNDLFEQAENGEFIVVPPIISDVSLNKNKKNTNELTMFSGAPIRNKNGDIIAILTFRINPLEDFINIAKFGNFGSTGETYGIDSKGYLVTQSKFAENLNKDSLQIDISNKSNFKITNPEINKSNSVKISNDKLPLTKAAKSVLSKENKIDINGYNDYRGVEVLGLWVWDEILQLGFITEIDVDEALNPYYKSRNIVLFMLFMTIALVFIFMYFFIRLSKKNRQKLKVINEGLEITVKERTKQLTLANKGLNLEVGKNEQTQKELINNNLELEDAFKKLKKTQSKLIQSEKMASLGNLIAGIAHEINTPIGAIKASLTNVDSSVENILNNYVFSSSNMDAESRELIKKLYNYTKNIKSSLSTKEQRSLKKEFTLLLENEQIENTREVAELLVYIGIRNNLEALIPDLKNHDNLLSILQSCKNMASISKNHQTIRLSIDKASKMVFALKSFSHKGNNEEKIKFSVIDNIETVLTIYNNILKQGIQLNKKFNDVPEIYGYPDALSQVWTNLFHNAVQAMDNKGILTIEVKSTSEKIIISVKDSGYGISDEVKNLIFDPFFTTKAIGEGTGIGLDIVKRIVDNHDGNIYFESEMNKGTTFYVELPLK